MPLVRLKEGVSLRGLQPQMSFAESVITAVFFSHGFDHWITAGTEGKHGRNSLHFVGLALDSRIRHIREALGEDAEELIERIVAEIRACLGDEYDVILEATHIHTEFQPETGLNL